MKQPVTYDLAGVMPLLVGVQQIPRPRDPSVIEPAEVPMPLSGPPKQWVVETRGTLECPGCLEILEKGTLGNATTAPVFGSHLRKPMLKL